MKTPPRITETEWEILRAVWAGHPVTATEIVARLVQADPTWHPKTTRALLNRLVQKGTLKFDRDGRVLRYSPVYTERECIAAASESFLERVFGGSLRPMLAFFVEQSRLSHEDVEELKELLAAAPKTQRPPRKSGRTS